MIYKLFWRVSANTVCLKGLTFPSSWFTFPIASNNFNFVHFSELMYFSEFHIVEPKNLKTSEKLKASMNIKILKIKLTSMSRRCHKICKYSASTLWMWSSILPCLRVRSWLICQTGVRLRVKTRKEYKYTNKRENINTLPLKASCGVIWP